MGGYIPNPAAARRAMLDSLGLDDVDGLFSAIPERIRLKRPLDLPEGLPEMEAMAVMREIAARNKVYKTVFRGAGAYRHYIPSIVRRIASKEEFVTAYTPYQPEISQGVLQSIFEFQTMICELTGMDAANASVYDGAVAAAEAASMCRDGARRTAIVSAACHPHTIATVRTYCEAAGTPLLIAPCEGGVTSAGGLEALLDEKSACVYVEQPNFFGRLEDLDGIGEAAHGRGAKFVVGANPIAMAVLKPPGECGADVAVGEGQPLGLPTSFGGPGLGFMACKKELVRKLPGRIVGETTDRNGERAFVLTLQTREQHIKREKASSNICSNQAHCALTAAVYMTVNGAAGMRDVAAHCMANARYLYERITDIKGFEPIFPGPFFHEFATRCPIAPERLERIFDEADVLPGLHLNEIYAEPRVSPKMAEGIGDCVLWCATECNTKAEIDAAADILRRCAQ